MQQTVIRLLPDGSGRVCIHWFERLESGPIKTPEGAIQSSQGPVLVGGTRGRIACTPQRKNVAPDVKNGASYPVCHSDDPRAVTCPACQATPEFKKALEEIDLLVDTAEPVRLAS